MSTHTEQPYALHFGAGNIGRGFVGAVLAHAGARVVFADVNKQVVDQINKLGKYTVHILDGKDTDENGSATVPIENVAAVLSTDADALADVATEHNLVLITTAVGPAILPKIAPAVISVLRARAAAGKGPINVVACENVEGATHMLRDAVLKQLHEQKLDDDSAVIEYAQSQVGWANSAVDRIVPPYEPEAALDVGVEAFYEWDVDRKALIKTEPDLHIDAIRPTKHLEKYIKRKLYTLNCGHAITAYLGNLRGHATIAAAASDPEIEPVVVGALNEGGAALRQRYGFTAEEHARYIDTTITRFKNPNVPDSPHRVGRQPLRKLQPQDRLLGPLAMCREFGLPRANLLKGVAAALAFRDDEDEQARELKERIEREGIDKVVVDLLGLGPDNEDVKGVLEAYAQIEKSSK
ncbi:mannitol dehydrogenase C-terminal domain-containing protein [Schizophyllum fasciatum]